MDDVAESVVRVPLIRVRDARAGGPGGGSVQPGDGFAGGYRCRDECGAEPANKNELSPLDLKGVSGLCSAGPEARPPCGSGRLGGICHTFALRRWVQPCSAGGAARTGVPTRETVPPHGSWPESQISDRFTWITTQSRARKARCGRFTAGGWGTTRSPKMRSPLGCFPPDLSW